MLTGCGNASLNGTWVSVKQVDSDGTVRKEKNSDTEETFVFSGDSAVQTVKGGGEEITITHVVEKISDTEYKLIAGGKIDYATLTIKGNQFSFRIHTGMNPEDIEAIKKAMPDLDTSYLESLPEYTDYYFKKVK